MVGKSLSHYKILEELGRGGMGIVYKAEDTKLSRTVAIKVLPSAALASKDDRTRFYREAKAAAQLNHPNIAGIHQIDEAVPSDAPHGTEPSPFIAMEYIDGENLHDAISKGPFKIEKAVQVALQIASGLQDAHDQNIVHRDIKTGNVMLSAKGEAKILDFGLAQTIASTKLTREGAALGTISYMSPEQARGESVDARTDIWSLGVILYELITGRHPFPGEYEQAVIYEIVNQEPEPPTGLRTGVPMELERITFKCLSKDREIRYQSAMEMIADLKGLKSRGSGSVSASATGVITPSVSRIQTKSTSITRRHIALGVLVAVLAAALTWAFKPTPADSTRISLEGPESLRSGRISPNGQRIAYQFENDIFVRTFTETEPTQFTPQAPPRNLTWSPDSDEILFVSEGSQLSVLNIDSGEFRVVVRAGAGISVVIWPFSGQIILLTSAGLFQTNPQGTVFTELEMVGDKTILREGGLVSLPDGTYLYPNIGDGRYTGLSHGHGDDENVVIQGATAHIEGGTYIDTGHLLFTRELAVSRENAIWIVEFDLDAKEIVGEPEIFRAQAQSPAFSTDEVLTYVTDETIDSYELSILDLQGRQTDDFTFTKKRVTAPAVSPDGTQIAIAAREQLGQQNIWLFEPYTGREYRVTTGFRNAWSPDWSPDGTQIVFQARGEQASEKAQLFIVSADGRSQPQLIMDTEDSTCCPSWAPDGQSIVFRNEAVDDMWHVDLNTGESGPVLESGLAGRPYRFSPDGRFLSYTSSRTGRGEIYITDYPGVSGIHAASTNGADEGRWAGDNVIFFADPNSLFIATVSAGPPVQIGEPQLFFSGQLLGVELANAGTNFFDVLHDGEHLIVAQKQGVHGARLVVIENARSLMKTSD